MINKLLNVLIKPKVAKYIDAKTWIQKILLEEKYGKNKNLNSFNT